MNLTGFQKIILITGLISALIVFVAGNIIISRNRKNAQKAIIESIVCVPHVPPDQPIRAEPKRFPKNTHLPPIKEGLISDWIDNQTFKPEKDLVRIDDPRVWWESDVNHDENEDDHLIHRSVEIPLRRLIELVCLNGGVLEVHDAYRDEGVHNAQSLHKEGRAIDVTCDFFSLEKLAKLCWSAGFDWVYYEALPRKGPHIHCSVRR